MILESKFDIGQTVYLLMDADQKKRMVCGVLIRPTGVTYELTHGNGTSWHYDIEISEEKTIQY